MRGQDGTSGVDWDQVTKIGYSLLLSPLFGFVFSALLLLVMKFAVRKPALYTAPTTATPPPLWIRGLLMLTCTGVSFFHGSNDGQKGMGLIMLILIGVAPTAYALEPRAPRQPRAALSSPPRKPPRKIIDAHGAGYAIIGDPRPAVTDYVHAHKISEGTYPSLAVLVKQIADQVQQYGSLAKTPADKVQNVRNDMYLASEALRILAKDKEAELKPAEVTTLAAYKKQLDLATKFIPIWVKIVRRDRARPRHDGRLEAHRRHRRREDRQDAPDLRPGRGRRDHRRWRRSARPTAWGCRSRPRTCCPPASPARWWPTARACSGPPCATSRSAGC